MEWIRGTYITYVELRVEYNELKIFPSLIPDYSLVCEWPDNFRNFDCKCSEIKLSLVIIENLILCKHVFLQIIVIYVSFTHDHYVGECCGIDEQ